MLIKVDESHSPVHVEVVIETDDESGFGLLKVEGDKLLLALGNRQKTPAPESRPEKLQWVSGVWYMELRRVKPGEMIVPLKSKSPSQGQEASSLRASPNAISVPSQASSEAARPATAAPLKVADTEKLELEVKEPEKLPPEKEPFTAWGKEIGGLQAGLGFEYGNRRTYGHGQGITLVVRLRNVGKEAVKFKYLRQFLDENPPTVTNADDKTIPQSKTEVMGQHVPVIVTLEPGKEMILETRLHGSSGVPYVLIPPNSTEKRDDKVTPLVVATGKVQLQIEKVFGNSSSGFLKVDPALEKLSTGKLELEVIR